MPKQKPKRAGVSKENGKQVIVWFDPAEIAIVDQAAYELDLDRSKFLRAAAREKLARSGR